MDVARYGGLEDLNQTDEELFSYLAPHPDLLEKQAVAEKLFQVRLLVHRFTLYLGTNAIDILPIGGF